MGLNWQSQQPHHQPQHPKHSTLAPSSSPFTDAKCKRPKNPKVLWNKRHGLGFRVGIMCQVRIQKHLEVSKTKGLWVTIQKFQHPKISPSIKSANFNHPKINQFLGDESSISNRTSKFLERKKLWQTPKIRKDSTTTSRHHRNMYL